MHPGLMSDVLALLQEILLPGACQVYFSEQGQQKVSLSPCSFLLKIPGAWGGLAASLTPFLAPPSLPHGDAVVMTHTCVPPHPFSFHSSGRSQYLARME